MRWSIGPLLVAAPVGAGDGEELDGRQDAGGRDMRAAAEVDEVALLVEGDLVVRPFRRMSSTFRVWPRSSNRRIGLPLSMTIWWIRGLSSAISFIRFSIASRSSTEKGARGGSRSRNRSRRPGRCPVLTPGIEIQDGVGQEVRGAVPEDLQGFRRTGENEA